MTTCCVISCKNNPRKAKTDGLDISFHKFPLEKDLKAKWIKFAFQKNINFYATDGKTICSDHFTRDDFMLDASKMSSLIQTKVRRRLCSNAVPTIFIKKATAETISSRDIRAQKKTNAEFVQTALKEYEEGPPIISEAVEKERIVINSFSDQGIDFFSKDAEISRLENTISAKTTDIQNIMKNRDTEVAKLAAQIKRIELERKESQKKYRQEVNELQNTISSKEKEIKRLTNEIEVQKKNLVDVDKLKAAQNEQDISKIFRDVFSKNQFDLILRKKKKVHWTAKEICTAFTLRYFSAQAYQYLRTELNYPLPALSSLRRWARKVNMRRGILLEVLQLMKIAGMNMSERQKVCVLAFDEVAVDATVEIDFKNDDLLGPNKYMHVLLVRGLFSNFKQPIFVDFDTQMSKQIIDEITRKLYEIGYNVVACVSDCGGGNQGLWKKLGINLDDRTTFIMHPVTNEKIYFFADVPHLLKLIRNWLLDNGFQTPDGHIVRRKYLDLLVEKATSSFEYNPLFNLTKKHVNCTRTERQNVPLAVQLLSRKTAVMLRRQFGDIAEARRLADVIGLIDSWFDVLNSNNVNEARDSKKCYGLNLDDVLERMLDFISNMRVLKKKERPSDPDVPYTYLQVFQKGVMFSILSLKSLYTDLKSKYNIDYIMTYKLNQDCVENIFAQIRQKGPNEHPPPLQALQRLRGIILGKSVQKHLKINQNTQDIDIGEEYLIASVFKKVEVEPMDPKEKTSDSSKISSISSTCSDEVQMELFEEDGFQYLQGWIARKFMRSEDVSLGNYTYQLRPNTDHDYSTSSSFVMDLSENGLCQPNEEWLSTSKKLEAYFRKFHVNRTHDGEFGFRFRKRIFQRTYEHFRKKFPDLNQNVLWAFVRQRIIIRVNHIKREVKTRKRKLDEKKVRNPLSSIINSQNYPFSSKSCSSSASQELPCSSNCKPKDVYLLSKSCSSSASQELPCPSNFNPKNIYLLSKGRGTPEARAQKRLKHYL